VAPQGENDAKYFGVKMLDEVAMTVQDRAYTSPLWYTPQTKQGATAAPRRRVVPEAGFEPALPCGKRILRRNKKGGESSFI
jgi:hypothetical protein